MIRDLVIIRNLSFKYADKTILNNLNITIKEGEWVTIAGPNNSGKTTLVKLLSGLLKTNGEITIDNLTLNKENIKKARQIMGIVFENIDNQFINETVRDEMALTLDNLAYDKMEIDNRVNEMAIRLKIDNLLDRDPHLLSGGEKQKVALASALITKPKLLILDDALSMLDFYEREDLLKLLDKIHHEDKITIINVTHNLEGSHLSDRIIVLDKGLILLDGVSNEVLKKDKVFYRIGLEVPFMVDLSIKLYLYGLIKDIVYDIDEMVDLLWK